MALYQTKTRPPLADDEFGTGCVSNDISTRLNWLSGCGLGSPAMPRDCSEKLMDTIGAAGRRTYGDIRLNFGFHLAPNVSLSDSLTDQIFESPKGYALDKLSESVLKQVADFFKKFDEQVKKGELGPPPGG